jgi:phage terminase large subunit-like protein
MGAGAADAVLDNRSIADKVRALPKEQREAFMQSLSTAEKQSLLFSWDFFARPNQKLPLQDFIVWLVLSGRGAGKTRTGAETCRTWVKSNSLVNIIAPTASDIRDVCVEGPAGIMTICPPNERPRYYPSKRLLEWPNGAKSLLFSAEEPERLRGPQCAKMWCDEAAAWKYAQETWDNAMFGLRQGKKPQAIVTTTPRPTKLIKMLKASPTTVLSRGTTYENRSYLAPAFFEFIIKKYEGTRLGRQEINAELLEDNPGALFHLGQIDAARVEKFPENLERVVVAADPAVTSTDESDEWGVIVAGRDRQNPPHFYVWSDLSKIYSPNEAADVILNAYKEHRADRIVAETNQGGDMIESILRNRGHAFAYTGVHASRGKVVRAEPISGLYEQGRVHHVGDLGKLEDEICDYDPSTSTKSPNRLDALVWALTDLSEGYAGGWLLQGPERAREAEEAAKNAPKTAAELAKAQIEQLPPETPGAFHAARLRATVKKIPAKPLPMCPTCKAFCAGTSEFSHCNSCGWDSRIKAVAQ